jgi:uncharacterized phage protein gp47/JayE
MATDPNVSTITQAGLAIESKPNIISWLISQFQSIYGNDVNVASNSPDGQLINIFAQMCSDFLQLLLTAYNSMAIHTSYGSRLDELVALNGLARIQGTYTQAQVLVTATGAVSLPGLDQTVLTPFTVADGAGNQFQLKTTYVFGGAGSAMLVFQAVTIGQLQTTANTITNIVTATLGASTVNNPTVASDVIGVNEENDAQLKIRHDRSFNLAATGPSDSMEAALKNCADITDALVVENNSAILTNGIPANTVWAIVNGGTPLEIAQAIYSKKGPGCGMKGGVTQAITRPNGQTFTAAWDIPITQPLYIKFSIIWRGPVVYSPAQVATLLAAALTYKLGQSPNITDVLTAMQAIAPTAIVTINSASQGVSTDNALWYSVVNPTNPQYYFTVAPANIVQS